MKPASKRRVAAGLAAGMGDPFGGGVGYPGAGYGRYGRMAMRPYVTVTSTMEASQ